MKNLFHYVSLRHLKLRPGRTSFAVAGIACGVALYVAISIINDSTSDYFKDSMTAVSGKTSLRVSAGELGFDLAVGDRLESLPGVQDAVPVIETRSWLLKTNESLMVIGADLLQEKSVRSYKSEGKPIIGDALTFISHPDSLIITDSFAKSHNLKSGDKLQITTAHGKLTLTVRGILEPTGLATAYGGAMAIMDIDAARMAFGKEGKVDRLDVVAKKGVDVDDLARRIRAQLGANYNIERPEMASAEMERMVSSFQFMSKFFSSLALIVGIFLISNCISISVAERRKEIGTLRALGTRRAGILTLFLSEAIALGSLGSLMGAFLGRALAGFMLDSVTRAMSQQYIQKIQVTELKFNASTVLYAVLIGTFASIIAAFWPSWKATRVAPVDAMKRKETGTEAGAKGLARYSGWIGAGLFAVSALGSFCLGYLHGAIFQVLVQLGAVVGAALMGPALVLKGMALLRPLFVRGNDLIPRLAVDNVIRNSKRTSANVMSLIMGLTLVVIIACVNVSFKGTLLSFFSRILHADLIISTTGRMQTEETQPLSESLKPQIEANAGVLGASELREVKFKYEKDGLLLKSYGEPAVPETKNEKRYEMWDVLGGQDTEEVGQKFFHSTEPVMMVSNNFVLHYGKSTGDVLELQTPTGLQKFKIIAVVEEYANPLGTLFLSRDTYQKYFNDPLVSGFAVKLKHGFDPVQVRKELDQKLSKQYRLTILLNNDIRKEVSQAIDNSFAYTRSIEVAALLVALLSLMNTLLITVMERTGEIGMSRAVGMTRSQVARLIFIEAAGQGGLGALVALGLGTLIGMIWVTQNLAHSLGWVVHFYTPWVALGTTLVLGVFMTMLAGWYPARRAAAIQIVEALDYE